MLREFAAKDDREREGKRWSYYRDLGSTRLIVMDSRTGRVLEEDRRSIFDEDEWDWIEDKARGDFDHLLIGTSDPYLLAPGLHYLEAWNEAVCNGAWGGGAARIGERIRRALDCDHWAAFQRSFMRLTALLEEVGSGERGRPPGLDLHPLRRRPPRVPRRGGVPPRREREQRRLPGGLLAVPEGARRPRAARGADRSFAPHGSPRPRPRPRRGGRGSRHPVALRRRSVLRQPDRDPEPQGARGEPDDLQDGGGGWFHALLAAADRDLRPTGESGARAAFKRAGSVALAVGYGSLCAYTVRFLTTASGGGTTQPDTVTKDLLDEPYGVALVIAIGVSMLGVAAYEAHKVISRGFLKDLETERMSANERKVATVSSVTGHGALTVIAVLVGVLLIKAAVEHEPREAIGLDGSLQELVSQTSVQPFRENPERRPPPPLPSLASSTPAPPTYTAVPHPDPISRTCSH